MPKKYNNKVLLLILIVLIAGWVLTKLLKSEKNKRSFKTDIVFVDTSSIKSIHLYPQSLNGEEIKFEKKNNRWKTMSGNITDDADINKVESILRQLNDIEATRLVARTEDKWEEYQLTDSLATRLKIINKKGKTEVDLLLGKFSYQQINPNLQSYNRNNIKGTSYVRLGGEKEIYAVDGFLNMAFNMDFKYWRDQKILRVNKNDINRLSLKYPADSGFVAMLKDSVWVIDSHPADSASIEKYLNNLGYQSGSSFADNFKPQNNPDYQLVIEGNNMTQIVVAGYENTENEVIIHSSLNADSYFNSSYDGVFSKIFESKEELLKAE